MDEQKYPVYDYVKFIWNKKLWLVVAAILFMIAGAAFSFTRTTNYTSTALVFTGTGNNEFLSKPNLIESRYEKEFQGKFNGSLNVRIKEPYQIELSSTDTDKNRLESDVTMIAEKYYNDMNERYDVQYGLLEKQVKTIKEKIESIEQSLDTYGDLASKEADEDLNYTDIGTLIKRYEALPRYEEELLEAEYDLELMEKPDLVEVTTTASSNNLLRNMLLGGGLGLQLMLVILVFWKYVLNARRAESQE
ncbi:Wzz/FepE/Etk N-terminal domain-containing protein [Mesobacillus subterraneus]|uniref:Wzz/FepE/Etk N-terminal domain-containing protein n=1 Tax=Mesobacillus subterraneus TaxID=285983 RepID=UPI001CFDF8F1|nr:Wzz/FepE/Etk N-terminal domain-containing protein [Mesobacillus subterraneus]WLR55515.1 Wzz/FepE/Etk N-terminal domain-containing protein [Mesobacillus subterraneus]